MKPWLYNWQGGDIHTSEASYMNTIQKRDKMNVLLSKSIQKPDIYHSKAEPQSIRMVGIRSVCKLCFGLLLLFYLMGRRGLVGLFVNKFIKTPRVNGSHPSSSSSFFVEETPRQPNSDAILYII